MEEQRARQEAEIKTAESETPGTGNTEVQAGLSLYYILYLHFINIY